jgi:hypothetical protein
MADGFPDGPLKKLPRDYTGKKHVVVTERCPALSLITAERHDPAPSNMSDFVHDGRNKIRLVDIYLVPSPRDTKPKGQLWAEPTARCRAADIASSM